MTQCGGDVLAWLVERCGSWRAIKMTQCEVALSDMAQCEMARYDKCEVPWRELGLCNA